MARETYRTTWAISESYGKDFPMNNQHFDVDRCLAELEAEDERQKEALRKFLEREGQEDIVEVRWTWIVAAAIVGAILFWAFGFLRAI
jgi:hypothetical protein